MIAAGGVVLVTGAFFVSLGVGLMTTGLVVAGLGVARAWGS